MRQTSKEAIGQVYVPQINWLLMVCVIGLVLSFGSSTTWPPPTVSPWPAPWSSTTGLLALVARLLWRWSLPVTACHGGVLRGGPGAFFLANAIKIPQGGWFPLLVGGVVFTLMSTWRHGSAGSSPDRTSADNSDDVEAFIAVGRRRLGTAGCPGPLSS